MKKHARYCLIGALALSLLSVQVEAGTEFVGRVTSDKFRVQDGDGLKIYKIHLRLQGVDAFETKQSCKVENSDWPCGLNAKQALEEKIKDRTVMCEFDGLGRYGRPLATCYVDGENLNAWLVKNGWGLAYRKYSMAYVAEEELAKKEGRGAWRGEFVEPWNWRHGRY